MELTAVVIVLGQAVGTGVLGWLYFRRWQVARPPIGVFNLGDVLFLLGGIVLIPLLYLAVPTWVLVGLLALGALGAVYVALEPIVRSGALRWSLVTLAATGEAGALAVFGSGSWASFAVNNVVAIGGVVGVANLWAQSGMKARDAAVLGGALTIYDLVATSYLPLMGDLFERLVELPFAPIVGWPRADGGWIGIGLGDLVVATVFPLVMRKAYGRSAGLLALVSGSASIVGVFAVGALGGIAIFPVMAVLGPAMLLQYGWWAGRCGPERTTRAYLRAEPLEGGVAGPLRAGPTPLVSDR